RHPTRQVDEGTLAGDDRAGRPRDDGRHAVGPRDGDQLRIGIDGDTGPQIGLEIAALGEIARLPSGVEFGQAEHGAGVDHAGVEMETKASHKLRTRGNGLFNSTPLEDSGNLPVSDPYCSVLDYLVGDRMDRDPSKNVTLIGT